MGGVGDEGADGDGLGAGDGHPDGQRGGDAGEDPEGGGVLVVADAPGLVLLLAQQVAQEEEPRRRRGLQRGRVRPVGVRQGRGRAPRRCVVAEQRPVVEGSLRFGGDMAGALVAGFPRRALLKWNWGC